MSEKCIIFLTNVAAYPILEWGTEVELNSLRKSLTATYVPLDPTLPREGPHLAKWRLQINVSPEELQAVRST